MAEIALHEIASVGQTSGFDELVASGDLVVVVVKSGDTGSSVSGDISQRATNTATEQNR